MINIEKIDSFIDNYIWLITEANSSNAIVVDPGDANPVIKKLKQKKLNLTAILITHHHGDHIGGVLDLTKIYNCPVYGPSDILVVTNSVKENDIIEINSPKLKLEVLETPGHTLDHIAYYNEEILFCGDTLFSGGCGRVFEGTHEQMLNSLNKLAMLDNKILVYCAHEYTVKNLSFAKNIEPKNATLIKRFDKCKTLREQNLPTIPSTLNEEKLTNPFLRVHQQGVLRAAERISNTTLDSPKAVFEVIRSAKDSF